MTFPAISFGEDKVVLVYKDSFEKGFLEDCIISPILKKQNRVNKNAGIIELETNNLTDSMVTCARIAADIWQSVLCNPKPIKLDIRLDMGANADVEIDTYYMREEGVLYPISYIHNFVVERAEQDDFPDAYIILKRAGWSCNNDMNISTEGKNLTYALLRAIGVTLGFGSSIKYTFIRGQWVIHFGDPELYSSFDYLVFSSTGKKLVEIPNSGKHNSSELINYITSKDCDAVYVLKESPDYRLYTPRSFAPYESMIYLDNPNSLMHYDLLEGTKFLTVDDVTIEILNEIGWNIPHNNIDIEIEGVGIGNDGIASAYAGHSFRIKNPSGAKLIDCEWSYSLPLKDGGYQLIKKNLGSLMFDIPPVDDENKYEININGDIYGHIVFNAKCNGESVSATYRVSLELQPRILKIDFLSQKWYDSPFYDVLYNVEYRGSDCLKIEIEEDYNPVLRVSNVSVPFLAHVESKGLPTNYDSWIHLTVENKYGTCRETIHLPAGWSLDSGDIEVHDAKDFDYIDTYNNSGMFIRSIDDIKEIDYYKTGLYILDYVKDGNIVNKTKYIKR